MMWVIAVSGAGLALVVCVSAAALVEVFRQLAEMRVVIGFTDAPIPLNLKAGELQTDDVGLPRRLASEPEALVILLSLRCSTCLAVAEAFNGGSPSTVWFVIQAPPGALPLAGLLADSASRVVFDESDEITNRIGINVTPAVLRTSFGEIVSAHAVATARQVLNMVPTPLPRQAVRWTRSPESPSLSSAISD